MSRNATAQGKRQDGRKSLLVYVKEPVITDLKVAALRDQRTASAIVEELIEKWLRQRPKAGS